MALVPTGKRRIMVAQFNPASDPRDSLNLPDGAAEGLEPVPEEAEIDGLQSDVDQAQEEQEAGSPSLTKFIFDFMAQHLGYPPRRLQEFKSQFVNEQGAKGQPSKYTITLPDQVYGKEQEIDPSILKNLVQGIEQKFGLSFVDYKRADLKLILSFSSEDMSNKRIEEDILDAVYKSPSGGNKGKGGMSATASTMREIIKESKSSMVDKLKKIQGV